ncbi:MAG: thermonuclease family protein [Methylobacteriaceae bacterium]
MSLTTTILLLYAACLVGAIASPSVAATPEARRDQTPAPEPRRPAWRAPAVLALPLAALVIGVTAGPARAGEPATRIAALATAPVAPLAAPVMGSATVIDGATLSVGGRRLRLHGIVAPALDQTCFDAQERGYACGRVAAEALTARIGESFVTCEAQGTEAETGVATAHCRLGAEDLAAWLVESGYAVADRGVSTDYVAQDERAWGRRRGLWAGVFDLPTRRRTTATAGL